MRFIDRLRWTKQSILFNLGYDNLCKLSADHSLLCTYGDRLCLSPSNFVDVAAIPITKWKTAHIYGSGHSIVNWYQESGHLKQDNDLHVAFNWAGLIQYPFDIYFLEIYGSQGIHKKGLDIAKACLVRGSQVYLKSLYRHNTSDGIMSLKSAMRFGIKCIDTYYCPDFRVNIPLLDPWSRSLYLNALFRSSSRQNMWPDAFSSPLTIIALLSRVGYERFILHGFDLDDSDYFFRYSTECIASELRHCIPSLEEKPPLSGHDHDSKRCSRLNLPLMLDLINKLGYAKIEYANP